jgi:hypothetical protein
VLIKQKSVHGELVEPEVMGCGALIGLYELTTGKSVRGELVEPWTDLVYNGNYESMSVQSMAS